MLHAALHLLTDDSSRSLRERPRKICLAGLTALKRTIDQWWTTPGEYIWHSVASELLGRRPPATISSEDQERDFKLNFNLDNFDCSGIRMLHLSRGKWLNCCDISGIIVIKLDGGEEGDEDGLGGVEVQVQMPLIA